MVVDFKNRTFKTLRLSLGDVCNFGCTYCVSENENAPDKVKSSLSIGDLVKVVDRLHGILDLKTIRLTGGEPTLYPRLHQLVQQLSKVGIPIKMTTNGFLLSRIASKLVDAGMNEINLSLDSMDEEVFVKVTRRRGLDKVLDSVQVWRGLGGLMKFNTVIMDGVNDTQVLPILEYAKSLGIPVRYLELMRMGHLFSRDFDARFYSMSQILEKIGERYDFQPVERTHSATANYFKMPDGYRFGVIANESAAFCNDCDRLRLDMKGNIYGCLSSNTPINIMEELHDDIKLTEKLNLALGQKQVEKFVGSALKMISVGG